MAIMLFVLGTFLLYTGRFSFGSFRTEGKHVKAAGVMLMMPMTLSFLLGIFIGAAFAGDVDAVMSVIGVLGLLELALLIGSVTAAYILVADPPNAPQLPGILGEIQRERRESEQPSAMPLTSRPQPSTAATVPSRESFPSVLSVAEAARYMGVSEAEIVDLIESGKLGAARINYQYRIARSNLDELLSERELA